VCLASETSQIRKVSRTSRSLMGRLVNPVIPEVVNQVAFEVIGNDVAITMAAEDG